MSRLSASTTFSYSPGPHDYTPPDVVEQFTVTLTTRLNGVTSTTRSDGRLFVNLEIPFALGGACSRASFDGIAPTGHAPLEAYAAGYWGSTCAYSDPAIDVFRVFSDDPGNGETLAIGFPFENIYSLFTWPAPLVSYDPDLLPNEPVPTITLELAGLKNLVPPTTGSEIGVQLPMRLILKQPGSPSEYVLSELTYGDAPGFTGSGDTVTAKYSDQLTEPPEGAMFAVTGRQMTDAIAAWLVTNDINGLYEVWWRIYQGAGDMLYRARCSTPDDPATPEDDSVDMVIGTDYRDRRQAGTGGGAGTFETTDLLAAQIYLEKKPLPFYFVGTNSRGYNLSVNEIRDPVSLTVGADGFWAGEVNGEHYALSWSGNNIFISGHGFPLPGTSSLLSIVCAGMVMAPDIPAAPPNPAIAGGPAVIYAVLQVSNVTATERTWLFTIYRQLLRQFAQPVFIGNQLLTLPKMSGLSPSFSPNGQFLGVVSSYHLDADDLSKCVNGRVYVADLSAGFAAFSQVASEADIPTVTVANVQSGAGMVSSGNWLDRYSAYEHNTFTSEMAGHLRFEWQLVHGMYWSSSSACATLISPFVIDQAYTDDETVISEYTEYTCNPPINACDGITGPTVICASETRGSTQGRTQGGGTLTSLVQFSGVTLDSLSSDHQKTLGQQVVVWTRTDITCINETMFSAEDLTSVTVVNDVEGSSSGVWSGRDFRVASAPQHGRVSIDCGLIEKIYDDPNQEWDIDTQVDQTLVTLDAASSAARDLITVDRTAVDAQGKWPLPLAGNWPAPGVYPDSHYTDLLLSSARNILMRIFGISSGGSDDAEFPVLHWQITADGTDTLAQISFEGESVAYTAINNALITSPTLPKISRAGRHAMPSITPHACFVRPDPNDHRPVNP